MATYEWDLESWEWEGDDRCVVDHDHRDKLTWRDVNEWRVSPYIDLVLVRDSADGRAWAYVGDNEKLPLAFVDAYGKEVAIVPRRFHRELQRAGGTTMLLAF
jgi:hypothetical protein